MVVLSHDKLATPIKLIVDDVDAKNSVSLTLIGKINFLNTENAFGGNHYNLFNGQP